MKEDTIVALATPEGVGGLAVIRVSGPEAVSLADRVFRPVLGPQVKSHYAVYGTLGDYGSKQQKKNNTEVVIDQVIALPMLAPHSFTGEDTVEFFCHGGKVVSQLVLSACRRAGARPATAGEFTRRAFLNGKMSLDQAEAVADLIHAESEVAARGAVRQLLGGLHSQLVQIEDPLLELLARLEGGLEFVDDEIPGVALGEVSRVLRESIGGISRLLDLAPAGRLLREGVQVVLQGAPNVGKSSLFNALVGSERAIVDNEAGTTRDVVSGKVVRQGRVFFFHDTAGLRETTGRVEKIGIQRTRDAVRKADIVLSLVGSGDNEIGPQVESVAEGPLVAIPVVTKTDLRALQAKDPGIVYTSSLTGEGLDELWLRLEKAVDQFEIGKAIALGVVINERHRFRLEKCQKELTRLLGEFDDPMSYPGDEVTGTLLAAILAELGEVSGRVFSEQLLETVFSRFCIGK